MFWVGAMLEAYHKLHPKPKTVVQLKGRIAVDLEYLAAEIHC